MSLPGAITQCNMIVSRANTQCDMSLSGDIIQWIMIVSSAITQCNMIVSSAHAVTQYIITLPGVTYQLECDSSEEVDGIPENVDYHDAELLKNLTYKVIYRLYFLAIISYNIL